MQSINEEECILLQTRYITFVHAYHITNNLVDVKKELAYQKEKIING